MDLIGTYVPPQRNEFECGKCETHITLESVPHVPVFPCQVCESISWTIYSINDTRIYPNRS